MDFQFPSDMAKVTRTASPGISILHEHSSRYRIRVCMTARQSVSEIGKQNHSRGRDLNPSCRRRIA